MKICFKDFRSGYKEIVVKEGPPACRTAKDGGAGACALIRKIVTRFVFVVIKKKEIVTRKNGRVLKLLIFEFHLCYRHTLLISLLYLLLFFYSSVFFVFFFCICSIFNLFKISGATRESTRPWAKPLTHQESDHPHFFS